MVPLLRTLTSIGRLVAKEVVLEELINVVFEVPVPAMEVDKVPSPTLVLTLIPSEVSTESARPGSVVRLAVEDDFAFAELEEAEEPRSIWREPSGLSCVVMLVTLPSSLV